MRITTKGQVTIPQDIRERNGMVPGSEVEFREESGRVYIEKREGKGRGEALVQRMRGLGTVRMTTDEIMKLTRSDR